MIWLITRGKSISKNFFTPVAPSIFKFAQHGQSGAWVSELLPHTAKIVDEICIIKTVNTDAINHDPAITFIQTGSQQPGRPSMGAWASYGIGSENYNLLGEQLASGTLDFHTIKVGVNYHFR